MKSDDEQIPDDIRQILKNLDDMRKWLLDKPAKCVDSGNKYPYDASDEHDNLPVMHINDWHYRAARGVIWDLSDRRGIKHGFEHVDWDVRLEIVKSLAEIIKCAHDENVRTNCERN